MTIEAVEDMQQISACKSVFSEYTTLGGDEELPLGEEFQELMACFVNSNEKKPAKRFEWTNKLIEQLQLVDLFVDLLVPFI